jgi:RNA polymerase sigma-70 factor (ECF subfamily)
MSDEHQTFRSLLRQMQEGSHDAAWTLVETYGPQIRAVVRRRMNRRLRSLYDSDDFVQSVWASFLRIQPRLQSIDRPEQLIALLSRIAQNRVIDEGRRRTQTIKHARHREVSIHSQECDDDLALADKSPTPSAYVIAKETWNQLIADVPDHYRVIIQQRFEGATYVEIAAQLGMNERSVRRAVETIMTKHAEAIRATSDVAENE